MKTAWPCLGLALKNPSVESGWAISLVLSPNGPAAAEQKLLLLIAVQLYFIVLRWHSRSDWFAYEYAYQDCLIRTVKLSMHSAPAKLYRHLEMSV